MTLGLGMALVGAPLVLMLVIAFAIRETPVRSFGSARFEQRPTPLWAALADRIGRKPVFIGGALGSGALTFAYLGAISSGNYTLIFVVGIALVGVVYSAANGVWPSLYGEMFSTRVRCSGMAIGTQIGFALGGFAPTIATALAAT